ncbi:MAG TPA: RsiV family protein [Candidatus Paceibacterota bacterium]|nr:RsiV family protein [Candidatus Paceibacterota bacterium]
MKKSTLSGIAAILVILGSIGFYAATRPLTATAPGTTATMALPDGGYSEHAAYYDIAANHATSTPLLAAVGPAANAAAVALMEKFVGDTIVQFKTDGNFANLTANDIHMMGFDQGRKEKLQIVYLIASSPRTVSYIYTTYEDTLGAHGNTFFHTFTFDTTSGAALSLADLFVPGADYLGTLSSIARAKLPAVIGKNASAQMLDSGTTPEDKNFANFFFDNKDFVILFAPYAVAPYSSGPQTLRIPVSELGRILKPEYR